MRKLLIHTEYICILNLIALPFLVMLYERESMIIWALLIFLDAAALLLKIDEKEILYAIREEQLNTETQRIKIYLVAIAAFYLCIPFITSWKLLLYVVINDFIMSALSFLFHRYIYDDNELDDYYENETDE
ncbi:MAG: hypothetical protein HFE82_06085 [Erysipelotrichaceae bacterium]|nr:hypothetical protein [Erysipelotrichaceae bacterium]